jgi:hypothetical protein
LVFQTVFILDSRALFRVTPQPPSFDPVSCIFPQGGVFGPNREGEGGGTNFEDVIRLRDGATCQEANAEISARDSAASHLLAARDPV